MSTSGAATARLCFSRNTRFVPSADSSAQTSPTPTDSETPVTANRFRTFTERNSATAEAGPSFATHGTPSSPWRTPKRSSPTSCTYPTTACARPPSAMTKLGARSRAHLVAKALGDGPLLA